jgi:hypothetical protein
MFDRFSHVKSWPLLCLLCHLVIFDEHSRTPRISNRWPVHLPVAYILYTIATMTHRILRWILGFMGDRIINSISTVTVSGFYKATYTGPHLVLHVHRPIAFSPRHGHGCLPGHCRCRVPLLKGLRTMTWWYIDFGYNWHRIGTGPRESMSHESTLKFVQNLCFLMLHFLAETQSTWGLWYLDIFVSHTWEVAIYFFVWWVEWLSLAVILHDDNHIAPQKLFPNKYETIHGKFT